MSKPKDAELLAIIKNNLEHIENARDITDELKELELIINEMEAKDTNTQLRELITWTIEQIESIKANSEPVSYGDPFGPMYMVDADDIQDLQKQLEAKFKEIEP